MPMFPPTPFPRLNGHELSRTSVDLRIAAPFGLGSQAIIGWTSLNFESVRAPGISHGSRSKPQARTRGKTTFTGDITIYEHTWADLRAFLVRAGIALNQSWSEVSTILTLTYFEPSLGAGVQMIQLVGAQFLSAKQAISDSDDQLTRNITLGLMDILEDGISAVLENTTTGF